jgi:2-phospho-L-lactate/phosphoenolpyruvate guanylyltransferase
MSTLAILPVKRFGQAKQRLGDTLTVDARRELAEAMVSDVLAALGEVTELAGVIVVSGEPIALELAARANAETVADNRDSGQSAAARLGIERAQQRGCERVLLVPGDCPALDPAQVASLLRAGFPAPSVTIVPDRHGSGTNALLLAPPTAISPSFGPGSCARHEQLALAAGAAAEIAPAASLALDVDTGADLEALRAMLAAGDGGAPRTRAVIARVGPDTV